MQPPSRTTSALGYARPYSRTGDRPPSPEKRLPRPYPRIMDRPSSPEKRPLGLSHASKSSISTRTPIQTPVSKTASRLKQPKAAPTTPKLGGVAAPLFSSKTLPSRNATRSPVKELFSDNQAKSNGQGNVTKLISKPKTVPSSARKVPSTKSKSPTSSQSIDTPDDSTKASLESRKASASSQSLREVIAKAKSARRSNANSSNFVPRAVEDDLLISVGAETDPTTFGLLDSGHVNILKKRISNARSDGKLNIAALCLTEIPVEVLKMYDYDANEGNNSSWYENVDVTRLNAADNELEKLPDEVFPPENGRNTEESEPQQAIFAGLEVIDLHGNRLSGLPAGFDQLARLTVVNLSRNKLHHQAIDTICRVKSLRELRLAENTLEGALPESVSGLENLEILDVHKNNITELPSSLGKLSKLKTLDVSENRLTALPLEAIFDLPLSGILASRNRLSGAFVPASIPTFPFLQTLDISTNSLTALTDGKVDFPNLRSLNISFNRISALPEMSNWVELDTLVAEENKISEIPPGFTSLKTLRHADFNFNSLLQLDDAIANMENLTSLRITNNPIRERRLLKLNMPELKTELRLRLPNMMSPDGHHSDDASSLASFSRSPSGEWSSLAAGDSSRFSMLSPIPGMSPIERVGFASGNRGMSSAWTVTGDTLDVSNTKLRELDRPNLANAAEQGVKTFNVARNQVQTIPACLEIMGSTMTSLDLTNNKLGKAANGAYLLADLSLPNLLTLNLTSNALTSLDPLVTHLSAPKLATLILLFNRLTTLPDVCGKYPSLTKLLASNNAVETLEVEHVKGLQVLDLSSNELVQLPAKLGMLQGQLRTLMVGGNKFKVPGWGVLEKGTEEILSWCRTKIPEGESMTL